MTEAVATDPKEVAVREVVRDVLPPALVEIRTIGAWLAALEGSDPNDPKARAAAAYRVWAADQLGLERPGLAAGDLFVIDHRICISAQLLRALAERDGYRVEKIESDAEHAIARCSFDGETRATATFTIEDAQRAGLADKRNWKTYPERMLWARASTYAIRDGAPGVALGVRTTEEMGLDVDEPSPPGAYDEPVDREPYPPEDAEWEALTPDEQAAIANEADDPKEKS